METPSAAEELPAEQPGTSGDDSQLYEKYQRLAAEQAALRRVAALVARGVAPPKVFDAVADEMRRCVGASTAGLWRFEPDGHLTIVAAAAQPAALVKWPLGTRTPIDSNSLAGVVLRTGKPARMDSYENVPGSLAARVRAAGVRAAVGVPITIDGVVWGMAAVGSLRPGPMPTDTEVRISGFAELVAGAVIAGHRDMQKRQLLGDSEGHPFLVDSLLDGRVAGGWDVWRVANLLRLPSTGPFVVIAASVPAVGVDGLPGIEAKLRSLDVYSAWRLFPDLEVGIAHVKSDEQFDKILAMVARQAAGRVGVSARFYDLHDTPQALHSAKVTLRSRPDREGPVAVFDGSILATAAVSSPDVMIKSVCRVLGGLSDLPADEREILFQTFRVWMDNDGIISVVADRLFCHRNTVRHRLRRIEKHTGRSLARPRDVAELCLAFEVHRRLM
jgi:hypothetical protein